MSSLPHQVRSVSIPHRQSKNDSVPGARSIASSRFQFLIGSLKTPALLLQFPQNLLVSIPHRQSKNTDMANTFESVACVSIPHRQSKNPEQPI